MEALVVDHGPSAHVAELVHDLVGRQQVDAQLVLPGQGCACRPTSNEVQQRRIRMAIAVQMRLCRKDTSGHVALSFRPMVSLGDHCLFTAMTSLCPTQTVSEFVVRFLFVSFQPETARLCLAARRDGRAAGR